MGQYQEMEPSKKAILILAVFYSLLMVFATGVLNPVTNIGGIIGTLVGSGILSYLILHIPYFLIKKTYKKSDETGVIGWIILLIGFSVALYLLIVVAAFLLISLLC